MPKVQLPLVYIDDASTLAFSAVPRPFIISRVPEPNEIDVPIGTPIEITLVDTGASGLATTTTVVVHTSALGSVNAFVEGTGFDSTYSGSNFTIAQSPGSSVNDIQKIQLIRTLPFASNEVVTVTVTAATSDSKTLNTTYTFTVEDLSAPFVAAAYTQGLTNLVVQFSEPVDMTTGSRGALRVRPLTGRVTFTAPSFIEASEANFEPSSSGDYVSVIAANNAVNNAYFKIADVISSQEVLTAETSIESEDSSLNVQAWTGPYKLSPVMEAALLIPSFTPAITAATQLDAQTVLLTLDQELSPGRPYTLTVSNLNDIAYVPNTVLFTTFVFTAEPLQKVENRNFAMWDDFIPAYNKRNDTSGDNQRLVRCLDEVTQLLIHDIDTLTNLQDVDLLPSNALDLTLASLGNPFLFLDDDLTKRKTIAGLVQTFKDKGTDRGIENAVLFFLGIPVIVQAFNLEDGWILGSSSLGYDTILGTSEAFLRYSFEIVTSTTLTSDQQTVITQIVNQIQPAHTHFVRFVVAS